MARQIPDESQLLFLRDALETADIGHYLVSGLSDMHVMCSYIGEWNHSGRNSRKPFPGPFAGS